MPPTPTRSIFGSREELSTSIPNDLENGNEDRREKEVDFAATPLLPPLMVDASANIKQVPMQSPLQSPSVANLTNPCPEMPPLWTRSQYYKLQECHHRRLAPGRPYHPSITTTDQRTSSPLPKFHPSSSPRRMMNGPTNSATQISPSTQNPTSQKSLTWKPARQLRANWDLARCNYTKHLVRTGEHYGVTSTTYKLTEENGLQLTRHGERTTTSQSRTQSRIPRRHSRR